MNEIQKHPDVNETTTENVAEELGEVKKTLFTRRNTLKKSAKASLLGLAAFAFLGLGLPGMPIKTAQACTCSWGMCGATCTGGCFWGCTGECRGCSGCTAVCMGCFGGGEEGGTPEGEATSANE